VGAAVPPAPAATVVEAAGAAAWMRPARCSPPPPPPATPASPESVALVPPPPPPPACTSTCTARSPGYAVLSNDPEEVYTILLISWYPPAVAIGCHADPENLISWSVSALSAYMPSRRTPGGRPETSRTGTIPPAATVYGAV